MDINIRFYCNVCCFLVFGGWDGKTGQSDPPIPVEADPLIPEEVDPGIPV